MRVKKGWYLPPSWTNCCAYSWTVLWKNKIENKRLENYWKPKQIKTHCNEQVKKKKVMHRNTTELWTAGTCTYSTIFVVPEKKMRTRQMLVLRALFVDARLTFFGTDHALGNWMIRTEHASTSSLWCMWVHIPFRFLASLIGVLF